MNTEPAAGLPAPSNPDPTPEITLEEWIASCQSCCGVEPKDWHEPNPNPEPAERKQAESME